MENANKKTVQEKQKKLLRFLFISLLLILPLVYLFYKTRNKEIAQIQQIDQPKTSNIQELENSVNANASFENLLNLSMAYINNKMPGKSIDPLKKALELNPKSAIACNDIGVAYIMLEQYQNGIDACTKAVELDPTFQLAKNNLKWGIDEKNKVIAALQVQEQTAKQKTNIEFYINYGLNYLRIGNYDKSIEIWNKIFDIDPKNTQALNNIGIAFMMKYQYDDAIVLFKKAIELDQNNQLAKNNLAWAMDEKSKNSIKK